MKVILGGWAWLPKAELGTKQIGILKDALTVHPRKVGDHPGEAPGPIYLFRETEELFGMAREFFLARKKDHHDIDYRVTEGDKSTWPGDMVWNPQMVLRSEQQEALNTFHNKFTNEGVFGGMLKAPCGWGKTSWACALISKLQVPTLVVVHKEFLMNQWKERIEQFIPNAKVGIAQGDICDYEGKNIVIGMVHSLASHEYPSSFFKHFGLFVVDESHRIGANSWSGVPARFSAKWKVGITATPRRKDGADRVFFDHLGPILFNATEKRMTPQIRRVWTNFQLVHTANFNPSLISKNLVLKFLCASTSRNKGIIDQLILAVKSGRKILVLSERLAHLHKLEDLIRGAWQGTEIPTPTIGYYVGGSSETALEYAETCQIILATSQYAQEGLDVPALDTLFLTTPMSDIVQSAGRILRPFEGKKEPVIVDFRDDEVALCRRAGEYRDRQYKDM